MMEFMNKKNQTKLKQKLFKIISLYKINYNWRRYENKSYDTINDENIKI